MKWQSELELHEENGETIAVRRDGVRIAIPKPPKDGQELTEWLRYLSLDALDAARIYYRERWNWETGDPKDLELSKACEKHINLRSDKVEQVILSLYDAGHGRKDISQDAVRHVEQQILSSEKM